MISMHRALTLGALFGALFAQNGSAQSASDKDNIQGWADRNSLSIRKAFDGTKAEQSPATLLWLLDMVGDDKEYSVIDLAAKVGQWDLAPRSADRLLIIYPVGEYHRQTQESKRAYNASLGLKGEFQLGVAKPAAPTSPPPGLEQPRGSVVAPLFMVDGKWGRDFEAASTNQRYSALLTLISNQRWLPSSDVRDARGILRLRYYPYLGIEHFRTSKDDDNQSETFATGRLHVSVWPISGLARRVQFVGETTYRGRLSGELSRHDAKDYSAGLNYYFDEHAHFGLGLEYLRGNDPDQSFKFRERMSLAFKVLM